MLNKEKKEEAFSEPLIERLITPSILFDYKVNKNFSNFKVLDKMAINISPAGLTVAAVPNELRVTAIIKERLCGSYCINADMLPQATVTYTVGTPRLRGTALFIPITAVVSVIVRGCGCQAKTYLFNEQTEVSFSDVTVAPTAIPTLTVQGSDVIPAFVNCNRANGIQIADSLVITITTAAAPAA